MSYNKLEENYAELYSQLNKYENDIKVYKNQIRSLKKANSEYEKKKG